MEHPQLLEAIRAKISFIRKTKGLSSQYMADRMHMSKDSYRAFEKGRVDMSMSRFAQAAVILGEDPAALFSACCIKAGLSTPVHMGDFLA